MPNTHSYRKYIEFAVLCLLATALLWWFGRNLDWSEVGHAVANSDPYLLIVAVLIISAAYFLVGRAGEVVRPVVLSMRDPRVRPSASIVTIVVERIYDMSAVALMFAINLLFFKPPFTVDIPFDRI